MTGGRGTKGGSGASVPLECSSVEDLDTLIYSRARSPRHVLIS